MPSPMVRLMYKSADLEEDLSITLPPLEGFQQMRGHFRIVFHAQSIGNITVQISWHGRWPPPNLGTNGRNQAYEGSFWVGGSKIPLDLLVWSALRPWELFWTPVSPFRKKIQPFEILKISSKWPTLLGGSKIHWTCWYEVPWGPESHFGVHFPFFVFWRHFAEKGNLILPTYT